MKILHIASFHGNIGDNASHLGLLNIFKKIKKYPLIDRVEIRKSYNNYEGNDKLLFDYNFLNLTKKYDLIIFGGGGFLDYWVENSINGTTINIPYEIFDKISCPILITSIGCNPNRKVPIENYYKFKVFLEYIKKNKNITIALRNDGSIDSIAADFGESYRSIFCEILDHGFFYVPEINETLHINCKYAALNITFDQLEMKNKDLITSEWYYDELIKIINNIIEREYKIVIVPHIHQDIIAISELLNHLPQSIVRNNIVVAPCIQGDYAADFIFNIYKNSKFVIGSRLHTNVCSLNFNVLSIGLSPLSRIKYLHKHLSINNSYVEIEKGFSSNIIKLIDNEKPNLNKDKLHKMKEDTLKFYDNYFNKIEILSSQQ